MSWELSKENIQPIPQGRKIACLQAALSTETNDLRAKKRHEFEVELRSYTGDDPLDVWYRYVIWVQQNYTTAGKESGLFELCKKGVSNFHEDVKYKNDERFIHIWVTYANMSNDYALEVYNVMYERNIGSEVAMFYKAWAWELENRGNTKKANAVLIEGINRNARPVEELHIYLKNFQARIAKQVCQEMSHEDTRPHSEPQRKAFSELKTHGKSRNAPVNRVGNSVLKSGHATVTPAYKLSTSNQRQKTQIYVDDENNDQGLKHGSTNSNISNCLEHTKSAQENLKKPGPWNKVKVKSKGVSSSFTGAMQTHQMPQQPPVKVFEEVDEQAQSNQRNQPTFTTALSEIKDKPSLPYIVEPFDPTKRPMYDKWRVYGGPEEMSFEELRAIKIAEKLKKQQENDLATKLKLMQKELQERDQLINKLVNKKSDLGDGCNLAIDGPDKMEGITETILMDHAPVSTSVPIYEDEAMDHEDNIPTYVDGKKEPPSNDIEVPMDSLQSSFGKVKIYEEPSQPPISSMADNFLTPKNVQENASPGRTEMSMIRDLWNGSLGANLSRSESIVSDNDDLTFFNKKSNKPIDSSVPEKIIIYTDEEQQASGNLEKYEDKENCAPPNTKQPQGVRHLAGILKPSTDFASLETERAQADQEAEVELANVRPTPVTPVIYTTSEATTPGYSMAVETHPCGSGTLSSTRLDPSEGLQTVNLKTPVDLSIIMESSREYHSKSSFSSSSSSNNSTGHSFAASRIHNQTVANVSTIPEDESSRLEAPSEDLQLAKDKIDPFENSLTSKLLNHVVPPVKSRPHYHRLKENLPCMTSGASTSLVIGTYGTMTVHKSLAQGAYAEVYLATKMSESEEGKICVIKVQQPSCFWEFYICTEIQSRLQQHNIPASIASGFAAVNDACFYDNGSILALDYHPYGTLLDIANLYSQELMAIPCELVLYITIQLLALLESMHSCNIIHADLKPDNVMLASLMSPDDINSEMFSNNRKMNLKLIDFGRSIDMALLPNGTEFNQVVTTENFQSPEMKENRPWTYQIDMYGFVATLHLLFFKEYMEINKKNGKWTANQKLKRYWTGSLILTEMMDALLNIPDCQSIPDISKFRVQLEQLLLNEKIHQKLKSSIESMNNLISSATSK